MEISDFLQTHLSREAVCLMAFESDLPSHLDAYLQQIWGEGRILIVAESEYREFAEQQLAPSLRAHGIDPVYCLCIPTPGMTYRAQIEESLGDGALSGIVGIAGLGSAMLFAAVRERAALLGLPCCALLNELPPIDAFDDCGEGHPCADAIFCDLDAIARGLHNDLRDAILGLEIDVCARRADIAAQHALGHADHAAIPDALQNAVPPRIPPMGPHSEDELAQLCESYAWRALAERLSRLGSSFRTVNDYAAAGTDFPHLPVAVHATVMAAIFEAALNLESLEISPENCADHQPPREMLQRTLQQILLADGVPFEWLKRADAQYVDRNALRLSLHTLAMNWDDFAARLRPIADLMHALGAQIDTDESDDPALKALWIHAARFAPRYSFLRLFQVLDLVEPSLYI